MYSTKHVMPQIFFGLIPTKTIWTLFFSSPSTAHRAQQEKNCSETDSGNDCEKVSGVLSWFCVCPVVLYTLYCLSLITVTPISFFPPREMANCRTETVTADMPLCQRRRRTWRCSGGEGSAVALSSIIKLHGRWTLWKKLLIIYRAVHLSFLSVPSHPSFDLFFCLSIPSLSAGTSWTSSWKLREPTWRSCSVYYRCLFTPQNVYSRLPFTCA